jgi:sterol desaturase/sphingolipid hydroxylase (fatty acid hydroxylase superfamily)
MYRAHMTHHLINYPAKRFLSDNYHSSGSDSLAIWFAPFGVLYAVLVFLSPLPVLPILLGGAAVALVNSVFHDLTHVSRSLAWRFRPFRRMGIWHRIHHSKMNSNYGILSPVWDWLFRTSWSSRSGS